MQNKKDSRISLLKTSRGKVGMINIIINIISCFDFLKKLDEKARSNSILLIGCNDFTKKWMEKVQASSSKKTITYLNHFHVPIIKTFNLASEMSKTNTDFIQENTTGLNSFDQSLVFNLNLFDF